MSSPTTHTPLVAPPGHNAKDQNPGRNVDLTNDDSENVPTRMVGAGATLAVQSASAPITTKPMAAGKAKSKKRMHGAVGGPCGNLSNASNIPFLSSSKMRKVTLMYAIDTLPEDLQDANAPGWKDGPKLLELFKLPVGTVRNGKVCRMPKKVPRRFPQCLLLDAKTVADKMRVVSWWLSLEKEVMTTTLTLLKDIYRAPTNSNDLYDPRPYSNAKRRREMSSHSEAAPATVATSTSTSTTTAQRLVNDANVAAAREAALAQLLVDENAAAAREAVLAQVLVDENVAAAREALLLSYQAFLQATANAAGGAASYLSSRQHDALLLIRTDAATASKNGNSGTTSPPRLPPPERMRYTVLARNEESAKEMLGNDFLDEMRTRNRPSSKETVEYYADDHYGDIPLTF
jgi:hypothetical protein